MPSPRLTEEQQRLILTLSYPLPRHRRSEFLERIATEVAALPTVGDGALYRLASQIQKSMIDYPQTSSGPGPKYND
jgi:hypothetical protein